MKGIPTSSGIAIARAFVHKEPSYDLEKKSIANVEEELLRLDRAIEKGKNDIEKLYRVTFEKVGKKEAEIFNAHKMMIEDPEFIAKVKKQVREELVNSEWAVKKVSDEYIAMFEAIEDEYLRERASDLRDISKRLVGNLLGLSLTDLSLIEEDCIIVAEDLTPSDTAEMNKDRVKGIITELGGKTSHTSIIARTLGLPALAGLENITESISDGDLLILDGIKGELFINPDKEKIRDYEYKKKEMLEFRDKLKTMIGKKSISYDGKEVELAGNIGGPDDIERLIINDAEGVGLYRTEFLYMDRDRLPTEEEQLESYKMVAEKMANKPVIIRTIDIGGDKELAYLNMPKEMNPFLGYRAVRLALDRPDIFKTQLRAILRASAFGNIKIMFPMISSIQELRDCKKLLEEMKEELRLEGIGYDENIEVGIMVEIPAVAIQGDLFAKEVDFFSIGTNDLIQYTLAVDRGNQHISKLYDKFHPAVLRLIKMTIDYGHDAGIWVGMCGELAGDMDLIPLLLSMGLDEFSMSPSSILEARYTIASIEKYKLEKHIGKILSLATGEEVKKYLKKI